MSKECLKCGYERVESDIEVAQEHTCPSCGVVYSKFEASLLTAEEDEAPSLEDKMQEIRERRPSIRKTRRQESRTSPSPWKGKLAPWNIFKVVFYAIIGAILLLLTIIMVLLIGPWGLLSVFIFLPFGLLCLRKAFRTYYSESVLSVADNTLEEIDVYFDGVLPKIGKGVLQFTFVFIIAMQVADFFRSPSSSGSKEIGEVSHADAIWIGKKAVKSLLKDPDSAEFRGIEYMRFKSGGFICGEVNSKNSFGGFSGWQHFISAGTQIVYLEEQVSGFRGIWKDYCKDKAW